MAGEQAYSTTNGTTTGSGLTAADSAMSFKDVGSLDVDKPVLTSFVDVDEENKGRTPLSIQIAKP